MQTREKVAIKIVSETLETEFGKNKSALACLDLPNSFLIHRSLLLMQKKGDLTKRSSSFKN